MTGDAASRIPVGRDGSIREGDVVELLVRPTGAATTVLAGTRGTVVHRYAGGRAFEVELDGPPAAVLFVLPDQVRAAG